MTTDNRVPAGIPTGGQFATSARTEAGIDLAEPTQDDLDFARDTLGPDATDDEVRNLADLRADRDAPEISRNVTEHESFFPRVPLTPRDVEHLVERRGVFEDGYDEDDINRVLGGFESARFYCVWDTYDDYGYGGGSDFAGMAMVPTADTYEQTKDGRKSTGSWRTIHPDVWEYLKDPDSDIDPESIPSLLSDEVFSGGDPAKDMDDHSGDGRCNVAVRLDLASEDAADEDEDGCESCDESLDDNEGYDGFCGNCADLIEQHEAGDHDCTCATSESSTNACSLHGPDGSFGRCPECPA